MTRTPGTDRGDAAPTAASPRASCDAAADRFLRVTLHSVHRAAIAEFAFNQRLVGAAKNASTFDGILAEHALALEQVRDMLGRGLSTAIGPPILAQAVALLDEQITYVRALGAVAEPGEETNDA